jgi:hypothetical protein
LIFPVVCFQLPSIRFQSIVYASAIREEYSGNVVLILKFRCRPFSVRDKVLAVGSVWRATQNIFRPQALCDGTRRRRTMASSSSNRYDPWYAKAAFGAFLFVLVGSLVALYSGATNTMLTRLLDALS